ncbi:hypothetical protein LTR95_008643 [Oleoguttula sp. CCFEE 5521]
MATMQKAKARGERRKERSIARFHDDGDRSKRPDAPLGSQAGDESHTEQSTSTAWESPLYVSGKACQTAIEVVQDYELLVRHEWARHRLIDFNHWSEGVGLFAGANNALDHRLRDHPDAASVLISLLDMLATLFARCLKICNDVHSERIMGHGESIETDNISTLSLDSPILELAPWSSDEDSDGTTSLRGDTATDQMPPALAECCKDIENLIDRLLDLGVTIRKTGLSSRLLRADTSFRPEPYVHLERHLNLLLRLQNMRASAFAEDRRPEKTVQIVESIYTTPLRADQVHLVEANLRRRHRFTFARKRAATLARPRAPEIAANAMLPGVPPNNEEQPMGLDALERTSPTVAESLALPSQMSASAVEAGADIHTMESALDLEGMYHQPDESTQLSMFAARISYPRPPKVSQQQAFKCPSCYQIQPKRVGASQKRWKKHTARDLYPYTCPLVWCTSDTIFYVKRKDWLNHLVQSHQVFSHWSCSACGDGRKHTDIKQFEKHIRQLHGSSITEQHTATMIKMSERTMTDLPCACPVCNLARGDMAPTLYMEHLAQCIHYFSLLALPWNDKPVSSVPQSSSRTPELILEWLRAARELDPASLPSDISHAGLPIPSEEEKEVPEAALSDDRYFDENDLASRDVDTLSEAATAHSRRLSTLSALSAQAEPESVTRVPPDPLESVRAAASSRTRSYTRGRAESEGSVKAGRIWAREVDDAWEPCILTLDGGGIRSYSSLLMLSSLMAEVHRWEVRLNMEDATDGEGFHGPSTAEELLPCHYFDFMFGTSTGGIIATLLGRLRMSVGESLECFRSLGEDMFGRKRSSVPLTTKYYHEPFEAAIKAIVGRRCQQHDVCNGESDLHPWNADDSLEQPFDVDRPRVCQSCCLTAIPGIYPEAYLLRTYAHYYSEDAPNWLTRYNEGADSLKIWQVLRATTAVPLYFEAAECEVDGKKMLFKDGGINENNPSGAALSEFHSLYDKKTYNPAVLLSVGAGRPKAGRIPFLRNFLQKRAVMQNLLIKFTDGERQHRQIREYARGEHTWYKRLDVDDGLQDVEFDEWKKGEWHGQTKVPGGTTLTSIENAVEAYLKRGFDPSIDSYAPPEYMIRQTAEKLVRQRRARERQGGVRWETFVGKDLARPPSGDRNKIGKDLARLPSSDRNKTGKDLARLLSGDRKKNFPESAWLYDP